MSAAPSSLQALARAKVNLFLHLTGRREDGYHLLQSLTLRAETGDSLRVEAAPDDGLHLSVAGPQADLLERPEENLVLKAALALRQEGSVASGANLYLTKSLPIAAGLGGGSADAAVALKLLTKFWSIKMSDDALDRLALTLGADLPVCLRDGPQFMEGIGERLRPVPHLPKFNLVLANPMLSLTTAQVYKSRRGDFRPAIAFEDLPEGRSYRDLIAWLQRQSNDLEAPAKELCPPIADLLSALEKLPGCGLARMSGSGATCFGLFEEPDRAQEAAKQLRTRYPSYWIEAARACL